MPRDRAICCARLRALLAALLICLALNPAPAPARAEVRSCTLLDAAFSMLEKDNVILERYCEAHHNLTEARYPLGAPYYFGGHNVRSMLKPRFPQQTTNYYRANHRYLYGFDCTGFLRWVMNQAGLKRFPSISALLGESEGDGVLDGRDVSQWHTFFDVGDLLAVDHGFLHILMYVGTLREYGVSADMAPQLAPYLDHPLMIHCGYNPFYTDRYRAYIKQNGYKNTYPPDGGVTVSLVGAEDAALSRVDGDDTFLYFELLGRPLPVFSLADCTRMAWIPN